MTNVVVLCFNEKSPIGTGNYSSSGIAQVESILNYSYECVDKIIIYNLGLDISTIRWLHSYPKVYVKEIPVHYKTNYPHIMYPKHYAWKYLITDLASEYGDNILFLDAGSIVFSSLYRTFKYIEKHNFFITAPWNSKSTGTHYRENHLKLPCGKNFDNNSARLGTKFLDKVFENDNERSYPYSWGAITGFRSESKPHYNIIKKAKDMMLDPDIGKSEHPVHMHDQSVISLLTHREGIKMLDLDIILNTNINNMGDETQSRFVFHNGEMLLGVWRQHGHLFSKIMNNFYERYKKPTYNVNCNIPKLNCYCYLDVNKNITHDNEGDYFYSYNNLYYENNDKWDEVKMRIISDKNIEEQQNDMIILINKYQSLHNIKYDNIYVNGNLFIE
jgi:hypothetical protein